jgi:urate oxidase
MTYELGDNRYGKSRVRLVTVRRRGEEHDLRDLTVDVSLEGDFAAAHVAGENAKVIATDTMKNTVYALAKDHLTGAPELLGLALARHFGEASQVRRTSVTLREHGWARIETPAGPAPDAFVRSGPATRVATVSVAGRDGPGREAMTSIEAGLEDLTVMKTTKSGFVGFERDAYTTLADTDDRIMATRVSATWGYGPPAAEAGFDFDAAHARALERLLTTFAEHVSPSVQTSIWIIATAMLDADPAIEWVRMVLPNLHHWTVDLAPFGLENRGEVFVATTEPHGLIDATVRRKS